MAGVLRDMAQGRKTGQLALYHGGGNMGGMSGELAQLSPEEEYLRSLSPIDAQKMAIELENRQQVSPEQASANRQQNLRDLLSIVPGPGNVIAAEDATQSFGDAANYAQEGRYGRAALMGGLGLLSGFGAVTGLPTGRMAGNAARGARDVAPAFPAWHGSPHDFDEFKLDKIGTGEGAQAYGHGLYFAEHPDVAKSYAEQLGDYSDIVKWKGSEPPTADEQKILNLFKGPAQGGQPTAARVRSDITAMHRTYDPESGVVSLSDEGRRKLALFDSMQDKFELGRPGRLYHTEIDAEPHQLLDWDKPLSEQSEHVKAALDKMGIGNAARGGSVRDIVFGTKAETLDPELQGIQNALSTALARYSKNPTKENGLAYNAANEAFKAVKDRFEAFKAVKDRFVPAHEMSKKLNAAGLPGIRYLDQGSRGSSGGTSNYVIFDDKLVKIKGKE